MEKVRFTFLHKFFQNICIKFDAYYENEMWGRQQLKSFWKIAYHTNKKTRKAFKTYFSDKIEHM